MNRKSIDDNRRNKLLYDPNQRRLQRLGAFSMNENTEDEDVENTEEEQVEESQNDVSQQENLEGQNVSQQQETQEEAQQNSNSIRNTALTAARNVRNVAAQKAKQVASKVAMRVVTFILANPWILGILAIVVFLLLIIIMMGAGESSNLSGHMGLSGYEYYAVDNLCETVRVYNPSTNTYTKELDFETEYIPGVVYAEVGSFSDAPEVLKLFAVAARSFAITMLDDSCTIEGSARVQAFTYDEDVLSTITAEDHIVMQSVMDTYGLVAVKDDELLRTYYDAACYQGEDTDNYFIGYGSLTLGSLHIQSIPKSWANNQLMMTYINGSKNSSILCWSNHGYGISAYGSYYLATQQNYTMEDLLTYYNGNVKLYSIYQGVSNNYTLATSEGTNDILTMALSDLLASKGSSVEEFNEYLLSNILNAGIGTREAAIATAIITVGELYQNYGVRIPYTLCGQHYCTDMYSNGVNVNRPGTSFFGVDPNWGSVISNSSNGTYRYYYEGSWAVYTRYGPDCSGFISWLLHNAGFETTVLGSTAQGNFGAKHALNGTQVGVPGDLLWNSGHVMFVVGVDTEAKVYYIAHASGGSDGVKISTMPFYSPGNYAIDMANWYENNRMDVTEEEFVEMFRNGYVDY